MITRPTKMTPQNLRTLIVDEHGPHVSMYFPSVTAGAEMQQNTIRHHEKKENHDSVYSRKPADASTPRSKARHAAPRNTATGRHSWYSTPR